MDWYDRLAEYFPAKELKNRWQLHQLLCERSDHYKQILTPEVLIHFATYPQFIFFDYILIDSAFRGQGIGSHMMDDFKKFNKWLILEAEPKDLQQAHSIRRIVFYERLGFRKATHIRYTRQDQDGQFFPLDVYFWSPWGINEREIMGAMITICQEIHNYESEKYYGRPLVHVPTALQWKPEPNY